MHRLSLLGPKGQAFSVVTAGDGPVLMLVHGFPLDHRMWEHQLAELSKRFRVICPELRGFGSSTLAEGDSYQLSDLADDLEFVRQSLAHDEKIVLCGLSMGGYVGFESWSRHAEWMSRLILVSTKPGPDTEAAKSSRHAMSDKALKEGTRAAVEGMAEKLLSGDCTEEVRAKTVQMMFSVEPESFAAAQAAMAHRASFEDRLADIQVPTLVLTGERDQLAPPDSTEAWASELPDAEFKVLAGCGHLAPIEKPTLFNEAVLQFVE